MAFPKLKISDDDGNVADVTSNRLDVNAFLSTTDNTVLDNIKSALDTIKVDTEAIETAVEGTLTTTGTITSIVPGTGALNLGKQEDAAHSSGDLGVQMLAVRKGTPADLSNADGDYEPLQLDEGRLWASTVVTESVHPAAMSTIITYAQFDVGTSAIRLSSSDGINTTVTGCKEIIIQADNDNAGYVVVGDSGVVADTEGIRINAGDTIVLPIASTATPYLRADQSSQNVNVMVVK